MKTSVTVFFVLSLTLPMSDVPTDAPDITSVTPPLQYYCPPCGCCNDDKMLGAPGHCRACSMELIEAREGLAGPFLFFYTRSLTGDRRELGGLDLLHFIPGLIGLACYTFIYLKNSAEKDHLLLSPRIIAFSHYEQASAVSLAFVYLLFSLRRINRVSVKENGFATKRKSLLWLTKLLVAITVLLGVWSGVLLLDLWLYDFGLSIMTYYPLWLGLALFLYWVGYQCLFHNKEIFNGNGGVSYKQSYRRNLSAAGINGYVAALTGLMETEKPHLDSTLNLNKLADQLSMHPKDLTIVLNQGLETNFYDFLNDYRIKEAKAKLLDPQYKHLTILAIAYDSGFNSKSSFNALFKKYVKMTPKEFIKKFKD